MIWVLYVMIWVQVPPTAWRPKISYQAQHIERMTFATYEDCEWMKQWITDEHNLKDLNLIGAMPMEDCVQGPP